MIAVISDIHGNIKALQQALGIIENRSIDRLVICGDTVGYGNRPNECCELVQSLDCVVLAGNHDWAVCGKLNCDDFSQEARDGIEFTQTVISKENEKWLKSLPLTYRLDDIDFVHATLGSPGKFYYPVVSGSEVSSPLENVDKTFQKMFGQVCFVGHSHSPFAFIERAPGKVRVQEPDKRIHVNGQRVIIDVGSVGYSRTASKKGCIVFYDENQKIVEFCRFRGYHPHGKSVSAWSW